eukprot:gnl/TRDRNA2_/TRDRNA2_176210_c0_seq1.p1 gnl/TRDRNA2_/TRDRNA2_176210_c0~~gnl/TRDRNA2_/TRDRNA2_176210_c0_seq1.p1  ORF type:complete len:438 (+),score=148.81 gnl/TRDRNA2_/TRDRNA2_176210_c0_seq1:94-1407(+)
MSAVEKRIDPEDGQAYTWEEYSAYYKKTYKKKELNAYWETMKIKKTKAKKGEKDKSPAKAEPKAKAKVKAKAKAEPKAKAKAKAKAKSDKPKRERKGPFKVCVCGGAGGIGQPLSMLMALDPNVKELSVYDLSIAMVPPAGVAADLSHIEKKVDVKGYVAELNDKPIDKMEEALTGCSLVLIPAGMPRKPGMTRDDLFKVNADIAKGLVEACGKYCPDAMLALIVNPVNSIVPAMAELYKKKGLDPTKIVGVTTLDCVRANKFVGDMTGKNPNYVKVPVVGGHAGVTILPLFSQDKAAASIDKEKIPDLDKRVQDAGTEVVNAKNGKGSATLSMAYAGARLGKAILSGLAGRRQTECAYVQSSIFDDFPYFTSKVIFGEAGIHKVLPLGDLSEHETTRLAEVKEALSKEIKTGVDYAAANDLACPAKEKPAPTEEAK